MFTGIIEKVGHLQAQEARGNGARLTVSHTRWETPLIPGESVAVQGACLTVVACSETTFACDLLQETLDRTCLGDKVPGSLLNLERAMRADGRFGGHMVAGHVDGTGIVSRLEPTGNDRLLEIETPTALLAEIVEKGSIAVDGISLTISSVSKTHLQVQIIPFTWEHTNLRDLRAGMRVNLETDIIAKHVRKLLGK